jgi:hypoxanthine phosphoribosyltransferase
MELTPENHKTLIDTAAIHNRINDLACQIERDYTQSDKLVLVCVLDGARKVFQALSYALNIPHEKAAIQVSSYTPGTYISDGNVNVVKPLNADINGADVVIVEDIIDTGYSMNTILGLLAEQNPRTLKVCALLSKPSRRVVNIPVDYLGFSIDDHFVFGFGIDVDQKYRELGYIGYFE